MTSILVVTPKHQMAKAAREAAECIAAGEGYYFRRFANKPVECAEGESMFYVEDGFVRGFAVIEKWTKCPWMHCDTTGADYPDGWYAIMRADSWHWVIPIPMRSFQGFKYFNPVGIAIVGDWKAPKPNPADYQTGMWHGIKTGGGQNG